MRDIKVKQILRGLQHITEALALFAVGNSIVLSRLGGTAVFLWLGIPLFIWLNVFPSFYNRGLQSGRIKNCADGCELLRLFLFSTVMSAVFSLFGWLGKLPCNGLADEPLMWVLNTLVIFLVELIVFWNGMIRIYISSVQLGIRWRVIGALCGMIPVVHLVVLGILLHTVEKEVKTENDKLLLNEKRQQNLVCRTKYPLLLVHGVFFRDYRYFNYWGRVPAELQKNGAVIFYGNHQSASSVADSGRELAERIREIVRTTGCEKVNIIAHSKGGLDCRYAIAKEGAAPYVASLTTINTPHRGCEFADYLLSKIPEAQKQAVAKAYNAALRKFGDSNPDFLAAVYDLTAASCAKINEEVQNVERVFYQSVGSKLSRAAGGRFPLNFSYQLVHYFDGNNDGLVGEKSFPWGDKYRFLTASGNRGISHGDMIDLNRENFDGFDVREFYVQLVDELRQIGL